MGDVRGRLTLGVGSLVSGLVSCDKLHQIISKRAVACVEATLGEKPFVTGRG